MSSETTARFPFNIKRRADSAVRHFPYGCGTNELRVSSLNDSVNHQDETFAKSVAFETPKESFGSFEGLKNNGFVEEEKCAKGDVVAEVGDLCDFEKFVLSKRRKVSAVRDFSIGCLMGALEVGKGPIGSSESKIFDGEMEVGMTSSSKGKAFDEVRRDGDMGKGSIVSDAEELIGDTAKGEGINKSSKVTSLSEEKNYPAKKLEGEVEIPSELTEELRVSNLTDSQNHQLEKDLKSEAFVLPNVSFGPFVHLEEEICNLKKPVIEDVVVGEGGLTEFEKFVLSKRRKVSAVRDFPFGCQRCASKVSKGPVASSESKVFDEEKEVGLIVFSKRKALNESKMDSDKSKCSIEGKVEELIGEGIVKSSKVATLSGEKKNPAKKLEGEVKRNDLNRMPMKVKELSREAKFKSFKMRSLYVEMKHAAMQREVMKGSVRVLSDAKKNDSDRIRQNAQGSSSEVQAKSLPKNSLSENVVGENREKKLLIRSSSKKKLEDHDVQRISKNLQDKESGDVTCNMVKKVLRRFQLITRKLLEGEEKSKGKLLLGKESNSKDSDKRRRADLEAACILKDNNEWVNQGEPIIGNVPGVEVGDKFHYRVELSIIGVHHPFQGGIGYTKKNDMLLATSIVASGGYPDDVDNSDVLIYSGSGGNAMGSGDKQARDQKLERGNLALKNSIDAQTPVRVIYGSKVLRKSDAKPKMVSTFTYDGLYLVEKYWRETGNNNFIVFKFQLRRMPGQPEIR